MLESMSITEAMNDEASCVDCPHLACHRFSTCTWAARFQVNIHVLNPERDIQRVSSKLVSFSR